MSLYVKPMECQESQAMLFRFTVVCLIAITLSACDNSAHKEPASASDQITSEPLLLTQRLLNHCEVTADTLEQARRVFSRTCDSQPRDCDPVNGQWRCSSRVLGLSAPPPQAVDDDQAEVSGICEASAATLQAAREAYAAQCTLPRRDCDQVDGRWHCSSEQIGNDAPSVSEQQPEFIDHENNGSEDNLDERIKTLITAASGGRGLSAFTLPEDGDFASIPQDPNNPITSAKVELGQLLFHDTAFALNGRMDEQQSWSCATCHHAAAGFKSGTVQGIGNGGTGFGPNGADRLLAAGFDGDALSDAENKPDLQPFASPSILHVAWQDVMLWNGQFGNSANGIVNVGVDASLLATPDTPKEINNMELSGVEVQAIAGSGVHRLRFEDDSPLQTNPDYQRLWDAAYGSESVSPLIGAGKAMAAYERTVIANQAPFQRWLRGDLSAMNSEQKKGAELFFGNAGCADCHQGPGLGSDVDATADQMFFALGFNDIDEGVAIVHGGVSDNDRLGRGGFTGDSVDNFKFKIPQLYNLTDANIMGHGGSFTSVRDVVEYKNEAVAQHVPAQDFLDYRFQPLGLDEKQEAALTAFVAEALYDPDLRRYQPDSVPDGKCIVDDDSSPSLGARCP